MRGAIEGLGRRPGIAPRHPPSPPFCKSYSSCFCPSAPPPRLRENLGGPDLQASPQGCEGKGSRGRRGSHAETRGSRRGSGTPEPLFQTYSHNRPARDLWCALGVRIQSDKDSGNRIALSIGEPDGSSPFTDFIHHFEHQYIHSRVQGNAFNPVLMLVKISLKPSFVN